MKHPVSLAVLLLAAASAQAQVRVEVALPQEGSDTRCKRLLQGLTAGPPAALATFTSR